ncbi:hypothetical protein [Ephemeroptericola cinctiostellae]|uniref:hypothetical protein n=1 Tax=Ephemeroptericola cinctiostellae TaxID=2268024 RepID=UPI000DF754E8|nr:hypothetical protein [Ephemeroptericola cinctiostellae]
MNISYPNARSAKAIAAALLDLLNQSDRDLIAKHAHQIGRAKWRKELAILEPLATELIHTAPRHWKKTLLPVADIPLLRAQAVTQAYWYARRAYSYLWWMAAFGMSFEKGDVEGMILGIDDVTRYVAEKIPEASWPFVQDSNCEGEDVKYMQGLEYPFGKT